jgi:hypothetical protein
MGEHTKEPWKVFEEYSGHEFGLRTILGPDGEDIIEVDNNGCASDPSPDYISLGVGNAYRIVACVNALAGIPTSEIEVGIVGEMREALKFYANEGNYLCGAPMTPYVDGAPDPTKPKYDKGLIARTILARLGVEHE